MPHRQVVGAAPDRESAARAVQVAHRAAPSVISRAARRDAPRRADSWGQWTRSVTSAPDWQPRSRVSTSRAEWRNVAALPPSEGRTKIGVAGAPAPASLTSALGVAPPSRRPPPQPTKGRLIGRRPACVMVMDTMLPGCVQRRTPTKRRAPSSAQPAVMVRLPTRPNQQAPSTGPARLAHQDRGFDATALPGSLQGHQTGCGPIVGRTRVWGCRCGAEQSESARKRTWCNSAT